MSFVPEPTPRGYSYLEDAPRYYEDKQDKRDNARFPPADFVTIGLRDIIVDEISKGKYGPWATLFVQDGVATFHKTSSGKFLVNKVASVSLNRSVQGAAAISHVSKVIRTHGISSLGAMVYNDGKLLHGYYKGDINMTELYAGLLGEVGGQGGDMLGWIVGSCIAGSIMCTPFVTAVFAMGGSTIGRSVGQLLIREMVNA